MEPNNAPSWNNTPNNFRVSYSFRSEHVTMSVPSMTQRPRSGFNNPIIDFRKTDLPVPEGPNITETSPGGSVNDTSFQMACFPKDFVRSSMTTSAPIAPPGACLGRRYSVSPEAGSTHGDSYRSIPVNESGGIKLLVSSRIGKML